MPSPQRRDERIVPGELFQTNPRLFDLTLPVDDLVQQWIHHPATLLAKVATAPHRADSPHRVDPPFVQRGRRAVTLAIRPHRPTGIHHTRLHKRLVIVQSHKHHSTHPV